MNLHLYDKLFVLWQMTVLTSLVRANFKERKTSYLCSLSAKSHISQRKLKQDMQAFTSKLPQSWHIFSYSCKTEIKARNKSVVVGT